MRRWERRRSPGKAAVLAGVLLLLALLAFRDAVTLDFASFDDEEYVLRNPAVLGGLTAPGLRWALVSTEKDNWHPLTWLSHMADAELYGTSPAGPHLTSVLIHAANAVLLFTGLVLATGAVWRSFFAAALFAVHPLRVESVAWIAERKDVLGGLFWTGTVLAYIRYVRAPSLRRLFAVVGLYLFGVMSKPTVVTLPFVLLLLDFWPLRRPRSARLIREKAPLFALAAAGGAVTLFAQRAGGAVRGLDQYGLGGRFLNAATAYLSYLGKTLWPEGLSVFYPQPPGGPHHGVAAASAAVILAVSLLSLMWLRRRPYVAVGWFWFLGVLLPVIGLLQVGDQAMADRYTYLPSIGLAILVVWAVSDLVPPVRQRKAVLGLLSIAVLGALTSATWRQVRVWRNGTTLFEHALKVTEGNWLAHLNLGTLRSREGDSGGAMGHYLEALRLAPGRPQIHYNIGALLARTGDLAGAADSYRQALDLRGDYPEARMGLGNALLFMNRPREAEEQYREVLRLLPRSAEAQNNLGVIAAARGEIDAAVSHFREAARLRPGYEEAQRNLEQALGHSAATP